MPHYLSSSMVTFKITLYITTHTNLILDRKDIYNLRFTLLITRCSKLILVKGSYSIYMHLLGCTPPLYRYVHTVYC